MSDIAVEISTKLVNTADKTDIIFTKSDKTDNLIQLVYEQRVSAKEISDVVIADAPEKEQKKLILLYSNNLIKYLNDKLIKTKLSGYRGAPRPTGGEPKKKLSKSEEFLERRKKDQMEKDKQKAKREGKIEKISLKEVGRQMQDEIEKQKELEEKIKSTQDVMIEEHQKHINSYQTAFELQAIAVEVTVGKERDTADICAIIRKMGDAEITSRQAALDKMTRHPDSRYALDALLCGLKDKNIIINILTVMQNIGERRAIVSITNLIKEFPTPNDVLFRGPALSAIGGIVRQMNEITKGSGTKYMYKLVMKPEFEPRLPLLIKIIKRDISNAKHRKEYFTPQCFKWLTAITGKVYEEKKKKVKVGFVNFSVQTDLSKEIRELFNTLKEL